MSAQSNEDFLSVSSFKVTIDGHNWSNYESVSGIGIDIEDISYQGDKNHLLNKPGRFNARDLVLSRRFKKDKELYAWMKDIKAGKPNRKSGSVILMDDADKEVVRFNFTEAWPKSWSGPTLSKDRSGNDILKEEIVLSVRDVEMN